MPRVATSAVVGLALLLPLGCSGPPGGSFDGSCTAARSHVSSLRASDGAPRWQRELPHPREQVPEVGGGLVLLRGCGVVLLDADDGRRRQRGLDEADEADAVGVAGRYLVSAHDGDVSADPVAGTGGFRASSQPPYEQVAVAGDLLLAASGEELVAWRLSGTPPREWRTTLPTLARSSFRRIGDLLVVRADDGSVYGLAAADGAVRWRAVPAGAQLGYGAPLAVTPDVVVVPAGPAPTREMAALDPATGAELWRTVLTGEAPVTGQWAAAAGVLAVPSRDGTRGVELRSGRGLWRSAADPVGAVGVGGTLVVAEEDAVVGLDPRSGRELWRTTTRHRPYLAADERAGAVVVLDSPSVPHGYDDCC